MESRAREAAVEIRAIAPLVVTSPQIQLVGPCTIVTNGHQTIAFSSAELLRQAGEPLAIALTLDCTKTIPVTSWSMGRVPHMGVIELGAPFPFRDRKLDVTPIRISSICATTDTRGAPSAIVTVQRSPDGRGVTRRIIPVHVDAADSSGMSDYFTRLASPDQLDDVGVEVDGAAVIAWMPPDPVLGRDSETLVAALAVPYRGKIFKPRELPPLAELFGLDDLARALPWRSAEPEGTNDLDVVVGELTSEDRDLER